MLVKGEEGATGEELYKCVTDLLGILSCAVWSMATTMFAYDAPFVYAPDLGILPI